jgi:uncharacterized membrane protein
VEGSPAAKGAEKTTGRSHFFLRELEGHIPMDIKPNPAPGPPGAPDLQASSVLAAPSRVWRDIGDQILSGTILVLPLLITFWVIHWLYSILEKNVIDPLALLVIWKFRWTTSHTELPYWFERYAAPLIAIILALTLLYCFAYFAETRLYRAVTWILTRVPVISMVYNPVRKMFQALEKQPGEQSPQRLVLIPFPHLGMKLPAFVTSTCRDSETQKVILCVYVPTTPVPTSGFFLLVPEEEVTELNWDSEQTLQAIMSGGLTAPPEVSFFKTRPATDVKPAAALVTS